MSGGQLQRAALARALLARPRVLICDEIATALDYALAQRVLDQLERYRRDTDAVVLLVGHDLAGLLNRSDRSAVVDDGRIAAIGTPQEVPAGPQITILGRLLAADGLSRRAVPADPAGSETGARSRASSGTARFRTGLRGHSGDPFG